MLLLPAAEGVLLCMLEVVAGGVLMALRAYIAASSFIEEGVVGCIRSVVLDPVGTAGCCAAVAAVADIAVTGCAPASDLKLPPSARA
jgi:hypothetical protein